MATHEIKPYANHMQKTKDAAPFFANYIAKGTAAFEDVVKDIAVASGITEIEARTILEGVIEIVEAFEREALTRFNLPGGIVIEPVAYGTLDAANSVWDAEKNSLELAFRMGEEYRNHLANVTPTIVTDVTITKADIYRVFDIEVPQPTNLVHGKHPFRIQGKKLFPKAVYFLNAANQRFDCKVVTTDPDGNAYAAKSRTLLEPGDYKLVVETDAGEEGGVLQYPAKSVKYLKVEPPPLAFEKVYSTALGEEGKWKSFRDTLECTLNDDIPEDAIICHRLVEIATGREVTRVKLSSKNVVTKLDDEKFSLRVTENNSDETDGTWCNAELYRPEVIVESASRGTITAPVVAVVDAA